MKPTPHRIPPELPDPGDDELIRQRLLSRGVDTLSDAELLSIVLREGTATDSAISLATKLLANWDNNLVSLGKQSLAALRKCEGMGVGRAAVVSATLELGRRRKAEESQTHENIASDRDVITIFQPLLSSLSYEEFWAVYLTSSHRIIEKTRISQGGISGTVVDNKLILKRAIERFATGIILVHNHPSGDPSPSELDKILTRKLAEAAALFDTKLLDHVIITSGPCFSFANEKLL